MREADEAVLIGPPPSAESYLRIDRIVEACRQTGAEAVHPGYGFLSERPAFARRWPRPASCSSARPRRRSRRWATRSRRSGWRTRPACRPCPAISTSIADRRDAPSRSPARSATRSCSRRRPAAAARACASPVTTRELREGFARRRSSEARASFGDDRIFIEKYIEEPRHIEIQVLGRRARQHRASGRARMLDPAPPSEGDRGGAEPVYRPGDPRRDGGAGRRAGARGRLPLGRHGRVHRRPPAQFLFPRNEHAAAGRASGDRGWSPGSIWSS